MHAVLHQNVICIWKKELEANVVIPKYFEDAIYLFVYSIVNNAFSTSD
jgi:hypothetical protein